MDSPVSWRQPTVHNERHDHERWKRNITPVGGHHDRGWRFHRASTGEGARLQEKQNHRQQNVTTFHNQTDAAVKEFTRGESNCVERTVPATRKTTVTQVHIKAAAHCWSSSADSPE